MYVCNMYGMYCIYASFPRQIPEDRGDSLAAQDDVTWLFFPFFYAPLVGGAFFVTVTLTIRFIK